MPKQLTLLMESATGAEDLAIKVNLKMLTREMLQDPQVPEIPAEMVLTRDLLSTIIPGSKTTMAPTDEVLHSIPKVVILGVEVHLEGSTRDKVPHTRLARATDS